MEITAEQNPNGAAAPEPQRRSMLMRIAVPSVAAAGAFALVWAGLLSHGIAAAAAIVGGIAAVAGAVAWEFRRDVGRLVLFVTGGAGLVASGAVMLMGGTVPWLLVGFWGSVAVLLAATLDAVVGPGLDRSATIAVVAVASLLLLSALGLGEYVRATWSPAERSILEQLPVYKAAMASPVAGVARRVVAPVADGTWGVNWSDRTTDPAGEYGRMRTALIASGWQVTDLGPMKLRAEKNGFVVELSESAVKASAAATTTASSGMYDVAVDVHVGSVEASGAGQQ